MLHILKSIENTKTYLLILASVANVGLLKLNAQVITGAFAYPVNQTVKLQGFQNFNTYIIDSTLTNAQGNFTLNFSTADYGMAVLSVEGAKPHILVLCNENIEITAVNNQDALEIKILQGTENLLLQQHIAEQPLRNQALSAWRYLNTLYQKEHFFNKEERALLAINQEAERIKADEKYFLEHLSPASFLKWYIPIRNLLGSVAQVAQYRPEEIPGTLAALRNINYADERLYKSGLLAEAVENHIWFIENSSGALDLVFSDLNRSIDIILDQLKDNNDKFNLLMPYIFEVLEKRSLFTSSEYLAKRLLEGDDCGCLNSDFERQLHKYGKMAVGATAPDIAFTRFTYFPEGLQAKVLSELEADYYLVIFAAGWCSHCREALPKLAEYYSEVKAKNIEVVMVSLDETAQDFAKFAAPLPFISTTDYQKWSGQAVTDYQVYATPSYFMLDKNLKILQKLKDVEHLKSWVDWFVK